MAKREPGFIRFDDAKSKGGIDLREEVRKALLPPLGLSGRDLDRLTLDQLKDVKLEYSRILAAVDYLIVTRIEQAYSAPRSSAEDKKK